MDGDTPEFRALVRRLRKQADEVTDSTLSELSTACAGAAESYERCLQQLQGLLDGYTEGRGVGDAELTEITRQVTDAEHELAKFRALLAQYKSQVRTP